MSISERKIKEYARELKSLESDLNSDTTEYPELLERLSNLRSSIEDSIESMKKYRKGAGMAAGLAGGILGIIFLKRYVQEWGLDEWFMNMAFDLHSRIFGRSSPPYDGRFNVYIQYFLSWAAGVIPANATGSFIYDVIAGERSDYKELRKEIKNTGEKIQRRRESP